MFPGDSELCQMNSTLFDWTICRQLTYGGMGHKAPKICSFSPWAIILGTQGQIGEECYEAKEGNFVSSVVL